MRYLPSHLANLRVKQFLPSAGAVLVSFILGLLLAGCAAVSSNIRPEAGQQESSVALPTRGPTLQPTPQNTRVLPVDVLTPAPSPSITPIPNEVRGLVVDVIDGDTIAVVLDGDPARKAYEVRYIGIEAPENAPGNPWGIVAYEVNEKLTKLKIVRLVGDETDFDAEGYLLRHVLLDNQLLSAVLAEQGLARATVEELNTRFESQILAAEEQAREARTGLWGQQPPTPTVPSRPVNTQPTTEGAETLEATEATTSTRQATATDQSEPTTESTQEATEEATATEEPTATNTPTAEPTTEPTQESSLGN